MSVSAPFKKTLADCGFSWKCSTDWAKLDKSPAVRKGEVECPNCKIPEPMDDFNFGLGVCSYCAQV